MRRRVWILLGALALGGSALAGVLVAHLDPAQALNETPPSYGLVLDLIPPYPETPMYPMGTEVTIDGTSRDMAWGITPDPPRKVADRYESIWESNGFDVRRHAGSAEEAVTATDPADPFIRSVVATLTERGTTIIMSVSEIWKPPVKPTSPVPPECTLLATTGAQDGPVNTQILELRCEGYLRELVNFYDAVLEGSERRTPVLEEADRKATHVTYLSASRHVVLLARQEDGDPPRVRASLTWQEEK